MCLDMHIRNMYRRFQLSRKCKDNQYYKLYSWLYNAFYNYPPYTRLYTHMHSFRNFYHMYDICNLLSMFPYNRHHKNQLNILYTHLQDHSQYNFDMSNYSFYRMFSRDMDYNLIRSIPLRNLYIPDIYHKMIRIVWDTSYHTWFHTN